MDEDEEYANLSIEELDKLFDDSEETPPADKDDGDGRDEEYAGLNREELEDLLDETEGTVHEAAQAAEECEELKVLEAAEAEQAEGLQEWQDQVDDFGGRISSPSAKDQDPRDALGASLLGRTITLPTASATILSDLPSEVTLCEMSLELPIRVDLSFLYPNLSFTNQPVSPAFPRLDQGDGFCRITWGIPQAIQQVALVDGNRGWRFPFVASYLRLDYIPFTTLGFRPIILPQPIDLKVQGMIAPWSGAPCQPLTKTVFYQDIGGGGLQELDIPLWAQNVRFAVETNPNPDYTISFVDNSFSVLSSFRSNGSAGQWPVWVGQSLYPVPQTAQRLRVESMVGQTSLTTPAAIYQLAL